MVFPADTVTVGSASQFCSFTINALKERPLKGPLGFCRGFMRLHKGYIMVIDQLKAGKWETALALLESLDCLRVPQETRTPHESTILSRCWVVHL